MPGLDDLSLRAIGRFDLDLLAALHAAFQEGWDHHRPILADVLAMPGSGGLIAAASPRL